MADTSVAIMAVPRNPEDLPGTEAEKHCTLIYLGDAETGAPHLLAGVDESELGGQHDIKQALLDIVSKVAESFDPLTAAVTEVATLGDDDPPAWVWKLDPMSSMPDLRNALLTDELYPELISSLIEDGSFTKYPEYLPHVTIGYGAELEDASGDLESEVAQLDALDFDVISLWWGEERWDFPLGGERSEEDLPPLPADEEVGSLAVIDTKGNWHHPQTGEFIDKPWNFDGRLKTLFSEEQQQIVAGILGLPRGAFREDVYRLRKHLRELGKNPDDVNALDAAWQKTADLRDKWSIAEVMTMRVAGEKNPLLPDFDEVDQLMDSVEAGLEYLETVVMAENLGIPLDGSQFGLMHSARKLRRRQARAAMHLKTLPPTRPSDTVIAALVASGGTAMGKSTATTASQGTTTKVKWEGPIGFEGKFTGDNRVLLPGSIDWSNIQFPQPFRWAAEDVGMHDGARVIGNIHGVSRLSTGTLWGWGTFDMKSELGREAQRHVEEELTTGVSLDLDRISAEVADAAALSAELAEQLAVLDLTDAVPDMNVTAIKSARNRSATLLALPAFEGARVKAVAEWSHVEGDDTALVTKRLSDETVLTDDEAAEIAMGINRDEAEAGVLSLRQRAALLRVAQSALETLALGRPSGIKVDSGGNWGATFSPGGWKWIPMPDKLIAQYSDGPEVAALQKQISMGDPDSIIEAQNTIADWLENDVNVDDWLEEDREQGQKDLDNLQAFVDADPDEFATALESPVSQDEIDTGDFEEDGDPEINGITVPAIGSGGRFDPNNAKLWAENPSGVEKVLTEQGYVFDEEADEWIDPTADRPGQGDDFADGPPSDDEDDEADLEDKVEAENAAAEAEAEAEASNTAGESGDAGAVPEEAPAAGAPAAQGMTGLISWNGGSGYKAGIQRVNDDGTVDINYTRAPGDDVLKKNVDLNDPAVSFISNGEKVSAPEARSDASEDGPKSGRGPAGNVRNFDAMNDDKFEAEAKKIEAENNDPEALEAIKRSRQMRLEAQVAEADNKELIAAVYDRKMDPALKQAMLAERDRRHKEASSPAGFTPPDVVPGDEVKLPKGMLGSGQKVVLVSVEPRDDGGMSYEGVDSQGRSVRWRLPMADNNLERVDTLEVTNAGERPEGDLAEADVEVDGELRTKRARRATLRENWVEQTGTGKLPPYIRDIADALMEKGMDESQAIATAVNTVERWAAGGPARKGGEGSVSKETQAKAQAALAEWEAKKAEAKADNLAVNKGGLDYDREAVATPQSLVASGGKRKLAAPIKPPKEWFADPQFKMGTPLTVTKEGRVFGHLALWGTCHAALGGTAGNCVTVPKSNNEYSMFHLGVVECEDGTEVPVGRLAMETGHADDSFGSRAAIAHYENTGLAIADVHCGEDAFGVWISGALRPDATETQIRALKASPLSGDWRHSPNTNNLELVMALAVNMPGFAIPRPSFMVASGAVRSLTAAGMVPPKTVSRKRVEAALAGDKLALDDIRYLKALASRERKAEADQLRVRALVASGAVDKIHEMAAAMRLQTPERAESSTSEEA